MNIAVVTPIYRHTHHLGRFLDSVLWQLVPGDTLVLCCERDEYNALEIFIQDYASKSKAFIQLVANDAGISNPSAARNTALVKMPNDIDWVKFLDADDVLAPFALETFRKMAIPESVQCITGAQLKVVDGVVRGLSVGDWKVIDRRNPTLPSMTFVRAKALFKCQSFDHNVHFEEDWDLWLRLRATFGMEAFATVSWPVCYYWIDQAERAAKRPVSHEVDGVDVREYFRKKYGINPER